MSNNIGELIVQEIKKYSGSLQKNIDTIAEDLSKKAVNKLKSTSPKKTGRYAKGWIYKKVKGTYTIYNSTRPRLTHLLEHGSYNKKGQKTNKAKPHIRPAEQEIINEFTQKVTELIE